jgi:hypothetical protein
LHDIEIATALPGMQRLRLAGVIFNSHVIAMIEVQDLGLRDGRSSLKAAQEVADVFDIH